MPFPPPSSGGGINQLTGDVTAGPGTGSQAATLAAAGTAGTYGSGQLVPVITTDSKGRVTTVTTQGTNDATKLPLSGGTMSGAIAMGANPITGVSDLAVSGLTGAVAGARFVGATTSGAPTTGTFAAGDFIVDQSGAMWVCTTAGTPGTWVKVGGAALSYVESYITANVTMTTASTPYELTSVSLSAGTWIVTARAYLVLNAAGSSTDLWIGPNSASTTGCYATATTDTGSSAGELDRSSPTVIKVVSLSSTTTVYLNAESAAAGVTAAYLGAFSGNINSTGITAVKIS